MRSGDGEDGIEAEFFEREFGVITVKGDFNWLEHHLIPRERTATVFLKTTGCFKILQKFTHFSSFRLLSKVYS